MIKQTPDNIILVQLMAIGDVLMCTPAVRTIRKAYPEAKITFLVSDYASAALLHNPNIDHLIVFPRKLSKLAYLKFLLLLLKVKYDLLIDFQNNPRSHIMSLVLRSSRKISFAGKRRNFGYSDLATPPPVEIYAAVSKLMLLKPLGIFQENDHLPEMPFTDIDLQEAKATLQHLNYSSEKPIITLSPVTKRRYKMWNTANYARLCDFLIRKFKAQIVFTWGPGEKEVIEEIINLMQEKAPRINYQIKGLLHLTALFSLADLHIGNDNGPRHFAISTGTPTICIFGHIREKHWTPPESKIHLIISPHDRNSKPEMPRINSIKFEEVIAACDLILKKIINPKN
jgi:ADP-heptose:LPS heptosyltransferase